MNTVDRLVARQGDLNPFPTDSAGASSKRGLRVAYLVNLYPAVSHTFIRREILALERAGVHVERIALRGWEDPLPDTADLQERAATRYALRGGLLPLLGAAARRLASSPVRFFGALSLALRLSHRAFRPWPYHLGFLAEASRILPWLRSTGIQHVHVHFGTNAVEVAMLVERLGGPGYSFTVHGPEEFDKPDWHKLRSKVSGARFVVAISSFARSQLYRWAEPRDWNKIEVVRCGLDVKFRDAVPTPPSGAPRLICVGRICEQKGQLLLVEAAAQVLKSGRALELTLAGDGEMRAEVEARIAALGISEHVRITGWISSDRVREELVAARALVLPSFAEGLPVVLMEAMALARPVLTTYVAGIPELVRDGTDGWLFPAGDVQAIVEAIQACLDASPDQLMAMGTSARSRVLERHHVDVEADKLRRRIAAAVMNQG